MLQRRNRKRRISFAQTLREIGPRARTAFRHARVWLWRFKRNPVQQDRAAAVATFAFIGLFAVGSVDAIITGGADFGPSAAYAVEYPAPLMAAAPQVAAAPAPVADEAVPETAKTAEIDYSFTTEVLLGGPERLLAESGAPLLEQILRQGGMPNLEPVLSIAPDYSTLY